MSSNRTGRQIPASGAGGITPSVIVFDLDDTLVEDVSTAEASFEAVGRQLGGREGQGVGPAMQDAARAVWRRGPHADLCMALGLASREGLWASFDGNHASLDGLREWIPAYRMEAWGAILATVDLHDPDLIPAAQALFAEVQTRGHTPLPGARETVRALAPGRRLGLLTNGPSDVQRLKLARTGLTVLFDAVAISGEMGVGKPSAGAFEAVLTQLGAAPNEAVMVGDSWERDVEGAHSCGLPAVWIAWGRSVPAQLDGVTVIETIGELPGVLG